MKFRAAEILVIDGNSARAMIWQKDASRLPARDGQVRHGHHQAEWAFSHACLLMAKHFVAACAAPAHLSSAAP